jgi:hypothetical protein
MMNRTAEVFRKIDALPLKEQEVVAKFLDEHFDEVVDEARWQQLFDHSPATLDLLGAEVDDAIANGRVAALDPDEL